MIQLCIVHTAR